MHIMNLGREAAESSNWAGMSLIRGGQFVMGSDRHFPEERASRLVRSLSGPSG
jgi:hypothetical protein